MIQILAIHSARGSYTRPSPPVTQINSMPAPIGGMDNRIPLSSNDPSVCVYTYNLMPSSYGLELRDGYREWQVGVDNNLNTGIGTIIPFEGNTEGPIDDRLFAVNNEGIWDVTVLGDAPELKIIFANQSSEAGYGSFAHYLDEADNEFLFYADSVNGLFQYEQATDSWTIPTDITGVNVALVNFVVVHKQRVWFCEQNSTIGWYLDVASRQGTASDFNFGAKFKHGGGLVGLYNWTVDGGDGVDDYLIAVSSAGDVLPYGGSDPDVNWVLAGTYFIGSMAKGSRCASQYGGNVSLLSSYGIIQMSDLLRGVDPRMPNAESMGSKISDFIRKDMNTYRNDNGWDIIYLPTVGAISVITPKRLDGTHIQYIHTNDVGGWGMWRDLPMTCVGEWDDKVYFGTEDGRVMAMDVSKDNILLDPPEGSINGSEVKFSTLMNYQDFGTPAMFKRGKIIRPNFVSQGEVAFNTKFLYDYDVSELLTAPIPAEQTFAQWDISLWDVAVWNSGELQIFSKPVGGSGLGRYVSVAIKGSGVTGTRLASIDVFWDIGGGL